MKTISAKHFFSITLLLSLAIGITMRFSKILDYLSGKDEKDHFKENAFIIITQFGAEILITSLVAFSMFLLNFYILRPVEKEQKWSLKQLVFSISLTIGTVLIWDYLIKILLNIIKIDIQHTKFYEEFIPISFFVSALVIGCVLIIRLVNQKQSIQLENEILRTETFQSQLESLKNQVSPHFLFNSLTALNSLISESPETAQKYINHLSITLRYTLHSHEKRLVTLREELDFTDSYLFLIKMRFNTNLIIDIKIEPAFLNFKLPPLTIQTLIENAVKHNEISKRKPLRIVIESVKEGNLAIYNNIQEKITLEQGSGIGLTNLLKQFQLLIGKEVIICKENNEFRVVIPLLSPITNESIDN
jgi:sensor histidine kinase YesM